MYIIGITRTIQVLTKSETGLERDWDTFNQDDLAVYYSRTNLGYIEQLFIFSNIEFILYLGEYS